MARRVHKYGLSQPIGLAMLRGYTKAAVSAVTAFSLAVALIASVFAQSHTVVASEVDATEPCVDHHVPQATDLWTDACATLCDTVDFDALRVAPTERVSGPDDYATLYTYEKSQVPHAIKVAMPHIAHGHDPPGSALYLTTMRLRL